MESEVKELVEKFRAGDQESAFHTLIELPGDILPALIEVFRSETAPDVRAFLVKVAWERRDPAVIPFLGDALNEDDEEVWQEAFNGLVAFASMETLEILQQARSREFSKESDRKRFRLWLDEAIEQVQDVIRR